ncbi:MAG: DUF1659 domain-containing protein [Bacillota bacterium]|jgi:hypothetical protein
MAVVKTPANTTLRLTFQTGVNNNGDPVYRRRSLNNVKHNAGDQNVYNVAEILAGLQVYSLAQVHRTDNAQLFDDGL